MFLPLFSTLIVILLLFFFYFMFLPRYFEMNYLFAPTLDVRQMPKE